MLLTVTFSKFGTPHPEETDSTLNQQGPPTYEHLLDDVICVISPLFSSFHGYIDYAFSTFGANRVAEHFNSDG